MSNSLMINGKGELACFESFRINRDLPKHAELTEVELRKLNSGTGRFFSTAVYAGGKAWRENSGLAEGLYSGTFAGNTSVISNSYTGTGSTTDGTLIITHSSPSADTSNAVTYPPRLTDQAETDEDVIIEFNEFFGYVRHYANWLSNRTYRRKVKGLEALILQTTESGQHSLKDISLVELTRIKMEYILAANGFNTYVEEHVIAKAFKHLRDEDQKRLDTEWITDFSRLIPKKALARKKRADKLMIFDNYVVMHITPEWYGGKEERMTKEQTDRMKDPILFGVMDCSRRLYYIADWADMYCDLNMSEMMDKFGDKALGVNEIWSRTDTRLPFEGQQKLPKIVDESHDKSIKDV
jgi:hypothetical protein